MKKIDNRKVRFAETFAQREEVKKQQEEPADNKNEEQKPEEPVEANIKPKKVKVNQEYVKNKVKNELKHKLHHAKNKRNMNKDKKVMKAKADIREYF